MSKEMIEFTGTVKEVLCGSMFRVEVETLPNLLLCHLAGKLRLNKIKIVLGDTVEVLVSPYDLTRGRIVIRK